MFKTFGFQDQNKGINAPFFIPGIQGWYRKNQGLTVSNSRISAWADMSGNSHDLLQATGANQPQYITWSGTNYLNLTGASGSFASTPDAAALDILGDISFVFHVAAAKWHPAAPQEIIGKGNFTGNQRSYVIYILSNGIIRLATSANGIAESNTDSSVAPTVSDGQPLYLLVILDVNDGGGNRVGRFYTSSDNATWTQLGTTQTLAGAVTIFNSNAPLQIGGINSGTQFNMSGGNLQSQVWSGLLAVDGSGHLVTSGATKVFDANFAAQLETTRSFAESSSNAATVTLNGGCAIIGEASNNSVFTDGVAGYLKTAGFTLNQPNTVFLLGKQITWTINDAIFDGNASNSGKLFQNTATPNLAINAGSSVDGNPDLALCTYGIFSCEFNGASSSIQLNNNAAVTGNAGAANMGGFTLGALGGAANFGNIQAQEIVIYNRILTASEKQSVINYLAAVGNLSI